ncbi:AAA family ATPase [Pseudalkalibacillus berkeleyi]|uniref:AAA family ATPase n=1 Tax=Pseudalkalibacillus berkeleyi TaxID=1069813 RepID=A0ABS9GWX9_9BACL|nr:AAA family ATPase [Pseudalkalibacillus berkeleyi]MCF6137284.1 AAA family ATPase [Pseudalkalibacillus berkeleyi]
MDYKFLGLVNDLELVKKIDDQMQSEQIRTNWYTSIGEFWQSVERESQAILIITETSFYNVYDFCKELSLSFPKHQIILLVEESEYDVKRALKSGANDILLFNKAESEIVRTIHEIKRDQSLKEKKGTDTVDSDVPNKHARYISVSSTKGGIGKSTLSVNLASEYAKNGSRVALIDLDLQFGDVALILDVKPKRTIYDWVKEGYGRSIGVERFMLEHSSGVKVLPSPVRPEFAEVINEEHIKEVLDELKTSFDIVIIDTPPGLPETTLTALEASDQVVVLTYMDLPTLKNTKLFLETLESLELKERIKIVLNKVSKVKGIKPDSVEKILGMSVNARLPEQNKVVLPSLNMGIPYVVSHPKSMVSKSVKKLADLLIPRGIVRNKSPKSFLVNIVPKGRRRVS